MLNPSPKSQRKKAITTLIVLLILSAVIYFYRDSPPSRFVQGGVQTFFAKPKALLYSIGKSGDPFSGISNKRVRQLEEKLVDYELVKKDNEALKNQFEISGETTLNLIAAKIIGFQGNSRVPTEFVINVGSKNKIQKGMTVTYGKYLIGKVVTVSNNYSVIATPFNEKFQVLAKLPSTNANGILVGRNNFMLFDRVIITDQLEKDGIIVTKGEVDKTGVGVVPDMIIGKITSISKRETAPFQAAEITPLVDYSKLTDVFVISQM